MQSYLYPYAATSGSYVFMFQFSVMALVYLVALVQETFWNPKA